MRPSRTSWWCLAILASGCLADVGLAPEVGELAIPNCIPDDSDPDQDVSFSMDVSPVLMDQCLPCHDPDSSFPVGVTETGYSIMTYADVRRGGTTSGSDIVVEGDPCSSDLVEKIGAAPTYGSRMPLRRSPLSIAERQIIADWIAEGARDN